MSIPFLDSDGGLDFARLKAYLEAVAPAVLGRELQSWEADPTDLLAFADLARTLGQKEHAVVFYAYALDELANDPAAIADDTNLSGAYYFLGRTLIDLQRPAEAIEPLRTAATMEPRDAVTWSMLGVASALTDRVDDALRYFERALNLEGVDKHQSPQFFDDVWKKIAITRGEL